RARPLPRRPLPAVDRGGVRIDDVRGQDAPLPNGRTPRTHATPRTRRPSPEAGGTGRSRVAPSDPPGPRDPPALRATPLLGPGAPRLRGPGPVRGPRGPARSRRLVPRVAAGGVGRYGLVPPPRPGRVRARGPRPRAHGPPARDGLRVPRVEAGDLPRGPPV